MSQDQEWVTCKLDPEIELVEEVVQEGADSGEATVENEDALETLDPVQRTEAERAVESLRPEAMQIAAEQVQSFRWNAVDLKKNVDRSFKRLKEHFPTLEKKVPAETMRRAKRLPSTALALLITAAVAARSAMPRPTRPYREAMSRAYHLRRLMMASAEALVVKGLLDKETYDLIKAGSGPRDAVNDMTALANIFRSSPELRARTPIDESDLDEAIDLATELSSSESEDSENPAVDFRDRIYTLLLGDWDEFFAVGSMQWKTRVSSYVPPLFSRPKAKKSSKSATTQTPAIAAEGNAEPAGEVKDGEVSTG